jgi:phenylalanyl-tRNA synthetase alpha chain
VLRLLQNQHQILDQALTQIEAATTNDQLEAIRVAYLGKNGHITKLLKQLGALPLEEKKSFGAAVNSAKVKVQETLDARKANVRPSKPATAIDITLPGARAPLGHRHPLAQTMEALKDAMLGLGFRYDDYPEVETEYHNFDSLNTPDWHPSRDMHDSFYTDTGHVVRTHTTAFQMHAMKMLKEPPIRAMTAGRCYRRDPIDATHYPIFHQLDAIAIDRTISFADLKWTLDTLLRNVLGKDTELRLRPSFFPFTTPSAEVDVFYNGRWMELGGSGMMRPEVLRNGGIDPGEFRGFAFGIGIDRITMAKFGITDIRLLAANEEAFLKQF